MNAKSGKLHPSRPVLTFMLIALLWLSTGLRFYRLEAQSFWNDEGNSARLSERPLALIVEGTASDVHPPLYYILLHGWRSLVGESEFSLRSFSVFAGLLTVAGIAACVILFYSASGRSAIGIPPLIMSTFLAAISPPLIYYSQETRMYALLGLLAILSTLVLLRWLRAKSRLPWAAGYLVLSTAGLYTHYFYPILFAVQGLIVAVWLLRTRVTLAFFPQALIGRQAQASTPLRWLSMVAISVLLYLPWVPIVVRQASGRAGDRVMPLTYLWRTFRWMFFGESISPDELVWSTIAAAALLFLSVAAGGRRVVVPAIGVLVPVTAMMIAGTTNPAFNKFLLTAVPFLLIWLALAAGPFRQFSLPSRALLPTVAGLLFLLVIGGMLLSLNNLYHNKAYARDNYREMAAVVEEAASQGINTGVILDAPNQWEVFTYYHRQGAPVYPLPKGQPDPAIIEPHLARIAGMHDRLYVLYWGDEQQDPQHVVESWLDKNTFKASEQWVGNVRFAVYATAEDDRNSFARPSAARFADLMRLEGYSVNDDVFNPGDIIQVRLTWSAINPLKDRLKVFLHVVDQNGMLVAQNDSEPMDGVPPTTSWLPGELMQDNQGVLLPATVAPGTYRLLLGLYPLGKPGERLPVSDGEAKGDSIDLRTIVIER